MSLKDQKESSLQHLSPYPLVLVEKVSDRGTSYEGSITYAFTSERNVEYELVFRPDTKYLPPKNPLRNRAYSFILERITPGDDLMDYRIKPTIQYAIKQAFKTNPDLVLSYQCSTEDDKQYKRALVFRRWFDECKDDYTALEYSSGRDSFATTIYRKDNPMGEWIRKTFDEMFGGK
jgi:hypothetical protein